MVKSAALLDWYDAHARVLPWRILPVDRAKGVLPDPYKIWLSEVMLQQTTVAAVRGYFQRFVTRWPTVRDLADANDADVMAEWAGLGYYARARNLLKTARVVAHEFGGDFPKSRGELQRLPGIGQYTSAAIASIAYDASETVVDGNVERVIARVFDVHSPLPTAKPELSRLAETLTPRERAGDYAQAVMDLGATVCTPKNPSCDACPWHNGCLAFARGTAIELPKKTARKPKPTRLGIAYVVRREDGAMLLETRREKGLLGGMLGWPGGEWGEDHHEAEPLAADWQTINTQARHTFTHFHLRLTVKTATVATGIKPETGRFVPKSEFRPSDLPTVMRKVFDLAQHTFDNGDQA